MLEKNKLFVDVHAIQTLPPSCLNRDDTGSPKTANVGGVTRARVSSQAWKRAMRKMFKDEFDDSRLGVRTIRIVAELAKRVVTLEPEMTEMIAAEYAAKLLREYAVNKKNGEDKPLIALEMPKEAGKKNKKGSIDLLKVESEVLTFYSMRQLADLAKLIVDIKHFEEKPATEDDKEQMQKRNELKERAKAMLKENPSIDMALFGRMVASDPSLNYDAAAQVAHSISTHEVHNEYDYFTAVDDCAPEDNAGAGHIGTVEFNAATLYRYATVNVTELEKSLGSQTGNTVRGFVDAFIRSMPTGKQNTFANRTFPDFIYVELRRDQPVNLSGAFEKPVVSRSGYAEASIQRLAAQVKKLEGMYAAKPERAFVIGEDTMGLGEPVTLPELLEKLEAAVREGM